MKKNVKTKIIVFGTFDVLHKGHLNFFKQARSLSSKPYLIVSVARDVNVKRIKGFKPKHNEKKRFKKVKKCPLVDKVVLGDKTSHLPHILKEKPAIIALGYDQIEYTGNLGNNLAKRGQKVKIRRLKPYKPKIFKSSFYVDRN